MEESKVVLVSGGSRGLGASIVESFLVKGYKVATFSRSSTENVARWEGQYGARFHFDTFSLDDVESSKRFLRNIEEKLGPVDILVNNAGVALTSVLGLTNDDDVSHVLDTNLKGTILLTRLVSRPMLSARWGRIINISSIVGVSGYRGLSVYSATKAGLDGFTRSLARELGGRNITVNSVAPGYLDTDMTTELGGKQRQQIIKRTPVGRMGTAEDVIGAIHFLSGDGAGFVTGQVLVVDGGITC